MGFGLFAAIHYWFPKMFGKTYNFKFATVAFIVLFVGFNVFYMTLLILGWAGMPRRYYSYLPKYTDLQVIATIGSWVMVRRPGNDVRQPHLRVLPRKEGGGQSRGAAPRWSGRSPPLPSSRTGSTTRPSSPTDRTCSTGIRTAGADGPGKPAHRKEGALIHNMAAEINVNMDDPRQEGLLAGRHVAVHPLGDPHLRGPVPPVRHVPRQASRRTSTPPRWS